MGAWKSGRLRWVVTPIGSGTRATAFCGVIQAATMMITFNTNFGAAASRTFFWLVDGVFPFVVLILLFLYAVLHVGAGRGS